MKFILTANTMEHPGFAEFVRDAAADYPEAAFLHCGDLLNVFPEPGEDLRGSIAYELYGELIIEEMARLRASHFANLPSSRFVAPLREMFAPEGRNFARAKALAGRRYAGVFAGMGHAVGDSELYFIPGNMDYPQLSTLFAAPCPSIYQLDGDMVTTGGVRLAGVGGIPHSAQPFRDMVPISPYEMSEAEYSRRLADVWGADVVITHISPEESPELAEFLRDSPVRLLVCRAPFDLGRRVGSCRGTSQSAQLEGKTVIEVRPFDFPENLAFVVDFSPDGTVPQIDVLRWRSRDPSRVAAATSLSA